MIGDDDLEQAREELIAQFNSRSLLSELASDPASAVPMVMMGLVFGIPVWLGLLAVFGDGRDPIGSDIFGIATIGFLISYAIAARMGSKSKAKRADWIRTMPPKLLAKRYCDAVHPRANPRLWIAMDRARGDLK